MLKKVAAMAMAALMVVGLSACGGNAQSAAESAASEVESAVESAASEVESAASEVESAVESIAESTGAEAGEALTIGLSMYTLEYPFYVTMHDAFLDACKEKGWECIVTNASTDASTQLNDCLDLLNKGIDALVLTSWYGDALEEAFLEANKQDIPVFMMDTSTLPSEGEYVTRIGTVNYDGGYVGGTYVGKWFADQGITSVDAVALHSGDEVSTDRRDGIMDGIKDQGVEINMLNEYHSASREDSMANFEDALTSYPKIDLVICTSAQHGMGAYSAAEGAGRTEMKIVAYDGEDEEKEAIDNGTGTYLATVTQDPAGMSRTIVDEVGQYIFDGATFEQFQSAPAGVYCIDGEISAADLGIGK